MSQNKLLALLLDDYLKEEACMKYINAKDILPNALVKELQNYIQGGYIYVPTNQLHQKRCYPTNMVVHWLLSLGLDGGKMREDTH